MYILFIFLFIKSHYSSKCFIVILKTTHHSYINKKKILLMFSILNLLKNSSWKQKIQDIDYSFSLKILNEREELEILDTSS